MLARMPRFGWWVTVAAALAARAAYAQVTTSFQDGQLPNAAYSGTRDVALQRGGCQATDTHDGADDAMDGLYTLYVALLRFDLSSLAPGTQLTSASLAVEVTDRSLGGYDVFPAARAWVDTQATWALAASGAPWATPGAQGVGTDHGLARVGTVGPAASTGAATFDLTSALSTFQGWVDAPATNFGFVIFSTTNGDALTWSSCNTSTPVASRPRLTLGLAAGGTASFQNGAAPTAAYAGCRDTFVCNGVPTNANSNGLGLGVSIGSPDVTSLLQFDLSALPATATVSGATLTLWSRDTSGSPTPVRELLRPWTETGATWLTADGAAAWATAGAQAQGTDLGAQVATVPAVAVEGQVDMVFNDAGVRLVQDWVSGARPNLGVALSTVGSGDQLNLWDREGPPASRPRLTVTFSLPDGGTWDAGSGGGDAGSGGEDAGSGGGDAGSGGEDAGLGPLRLRVGCGCAQGWGPLALGAAALLALRRRPRAAGRRA